MHSRNKATSGSYNLQALLLDKTRRWMRRTGMEFGNLCNVWKQTIYWNDL